MFEEHGGGHHDIGHLGRFRHELLMHRNEEIVAQEPLFHQPLFRRDINGIGVLDEQRRHRAAVAQRFCVPRQHTADLRLVELANFRVGVRAAHQLRLVEPEDIAIIVEGPAALILPGAENRGDGKRRMHRDCAIALAGKTVTQPEERLFRGADKPRKSLDLFHGKTGDFGCPLWRL